LIYPGNEIVHQLTVDDNRSYSLRVDLEAYDNESVFALYTDFFIGPESDNYRFHVHGYLSNSTAGEKKTLIIYLPHYNKPEGKSNFVRYHLKLTLIILRL